MKCDECKNNPYCLIKRDVRRMEDYAMAVTNETKGTIIFEISYKCIDYKGRFDK